MSPRTGPQLSPHSRRRACVLPARSRPSRCARSDRVLHQHGAGLQPASEWASHFTSRRSRRQPRAEDRRDQTRAWAAGRSTRSSQRPSGGSTSSRHSYAAVSDFRRSWNADADPSARPSTSSSRTRRRVRRLVRELPSRWGLRPTRERILSSRTRTRGFGEPVAGPEEVFATARTEVVVTGRDPAGAAPARSRRQCCASRRRWRSRHRHRSSPEFTGTVGRPRSLPCN